MNNPIKTSLAALLFILAIDFAFGQMTKEYYIFTKKADSLYHAKDFKNSGIAFSSAFKVNGGKGLIEDRYYAARSWSMASYTDSAFIQLYRITEKSFFKDYDRVLNEADFKHLHDDKRWEHLLGLIKSNKYYNLGFERVANFENLPDPWFRWGTEDYALRVDSSQKHSGKYSFLIEPIDGVSNRSFGCIANSILPEYEGKEIEVQAYMKMENVTEPIGLLLRIDGKSEFKSLEFDNMQQKKIKGTRDWTLYSVKLPLSPKAQGIYIGALLSGTGKLWVDDFQVLIDGKDLSEAKLKKK